MSKAISFRRRYAVALAALGIVTIPFLHAFDLPKAFALLPLLGYFLRWYYGAFGQGGVFDVRKDRYGGRVVFASEEEAYRWCEEVYRQTGGVTPELRRSFETYQRTVDDSFQ